MKKIRFLAFCVFVSIFAMCGCMGGGGSGSVAFEKDVAGITATLDRFAAAVQAKDSSYAGLFAQTVDVEQTTKILYVQDFGQNINDPSDNESWEFMVNPADINQVAPDAAIVRASKVMSNGTTLWLVFTMVQDQGVWFIEAIDLEESGAVAFNSANYFPIVPGSSMVYYVSDPENPEYKSFYSTTISDTETYQANGIVFYKYTNTYGMPVNKRAQLFDGNDTYLGRNGIGEIWAYSPSVNEGQPYRIMRAAYAPGETDTITEYTGYETIITTNTVGTQTKLLTTPLRTFSVTPVYQASTYSYPGETPTESSTEKSVLYFADGIGVVGIERYGFTYTTPQVVELLFERSVNGKVDSNNPVVASVSDSQSVIIGQTITVVQFSATGGTSPYTWTISGAPAGVTISSTGELAGTPDSASELTVYPVKVTAADIYGRTGTKQFDLTLTERPAISISTLTSSQSVVRGQAMVDVQFSVENAVGAFSWVLSSPFPNTQISETGVLSGSVPSETAPGSYQIIVSVEDSAGGTGSMIYTVEVVDPAPIIVSAPSTSQAAYIGQKITSVQFAAQNQVGAVRWSITGAPEFITISSTGEMSGTISSGITQGSFNVVVSATDSLGTVGTMNYTITALTPLGTFYMSNYYPTVPGDEYTYAQLIPGETEEVLENRTLVSTLNDTIVLSVGGNNVTFYKESTDSSVPISFPGPAVNIRPSTSPSVKKALRAQAELDLTFYRGVDIDGNIWQYCPEINGGTPYKLYNAWYNENATSQFVQNYSTGEVTTVDITVTGQVAIGTPIGSYENAVRVVWNSYTVFPDDTTSTLSYEFYMARDVGVVVFNIYEGAISGYPGYSERILETKLSGVVTKSDPLITTNPDLGNAGVGVSYSRTFTLSGGSPAYYWTADSATLPPGLTLDALSGVLSGTPTTAGVYNFTIYVIDYYYRMNAVTFTLEVL